MISFANAKINLGLLVTEKRSDGYHSIETVFYPIKLYDVIEMLPAEVNRFQTAGLSIPDQGDNLCERAFHALEKDYSLKPVSIQLLKNIPIGAGLGGGSSDAAQVLKMLNEFNDLGLSMAQLATYAERLGADCPFFLENKAVFASGIGTTFESVELNLSDYFIVVIKPDIHISTVEAYQNIVPQTPKVDLKRAIQLPIQEWKYHLVNDFELGIFEKYPQIALIKHELYQRGAIYAAMSGSGSAVYGIFQEEVNLDELNGLGKVYYPVDL
ncbi:4-diphosphocytidyl-2-C-methyl-D-erythritol kinase [Sphingobacterium nematocida]|uniref:4-diphosphocytidyl-2-C-methyl-D-erythritol kinase n=1 Tax=Sphingobacterium nematocida TaxID=1513896 RepID=A0A1T5AQ60_9SPHI|nr:4-(cytidine 5'-diphospho)-2-C-methyl-D-erythritol kinase [Sphingobacterium nematocida]SKB37181.1 4-diphosphocytidyl-2-C-methyl-D-erythritol kinase [Sphingobacterium nematocida]